MATYANREELTAVLDKVVAGLNENDTVKNRMKTANVSMGIVVSDLEGAEYVMAFRNGEVTGSPAGASAATVTITMKQEVLDRLFSGKVSGESAYFSGLLRLRGDEWVAESLASYVYYMLPIYQAATADLA
ncbi:MAG: SCP2 sterol-binding domain-containing protein [Anaerolineae bacterium]